MHRGALIRAAFLPLALAFASAGVQAEATAKLERYASCEGFAGGVGIRRKAERPAEEPPWREVTGKGVTRRISVIDGIRVVYAYPEKDPFADLKVEASDPAKYAEDKRELRQMFEAVARTEGPGAYKTIDGPGYTGQEVVKPALGGSLLAITQLFFDADKVVVSITFPWFPTQPASALSFSTHTQFVALRAAFVRGYLDCIERKAK